MRSYSQDMTEWLQNESERKSLLCEGSIKHIENYVQVKSAKPALASWQVFEESTCLFLLSCFRDD